MFRTESLNLINRLLSAFVLREPDSEVLFKWLPVMAQDVPLALRFLDEKRRLFEESQRYDYRIISLGTQCLPATLATRWGLKATKAMGEERLPFDLAISPYEAVLELFETEFASYRADSIRTNAHGVQYYTDNEKGILYNHDYLKRLVPLESEDEKKSSVLAAFDSVLADRVQSLRNALCAGNCLAVICLAPEEQLNLGAGLEDFLLRLGTCIRAFSPCNRLQAFVLTQEQDSQRLLADGTALAFCNMPHGVYIWHTPGSYLTEAGFLFEQRIARILMQAIRTHFRPCDRRYPPATYNHYITSKSLRFCIAKAFFARQDNANAIFHARKALGYGYSKWDCHELLAKSLLQTGDVEAAEAVLLQAQEIYPDNRKVCIQFASLYAKTNRLELAIQKTQDALRLGDRSQQTTHFLGVLQLRAGNLDKAEQAFLRAIERNPAAFNSHYQLGSVYARKHELQKAINKTREALSLGKGYAFVHHQLGNQLMLQGDLEGAEDAQREAIRLKPDLAAAHMQLGRILERQQNQSTAIEATRRAVELAPAVEAYRRQLERLLLASG